MNVRYKETNFITFKNEIMIDEDKGKKLVDEIYTLPRVYDNISYEAAKDIAKLFCDKIISELHELYRYQKEIGFVVATKIEFIEIKEQIEKL